MAINYSQSLGLGTQRSAVDVAQQLQGLGMNNQAMQQQAAKNEAQKAQQQKIASLIPKIQAGDYDSSIELASISPEISSSISQAKAEMGEVKSQQTSQWIADYQTAPDKEAFLAEDSPLDIDDKFREMAPEQREVMTRIMGAQLMDKQTFDATFTGGEGANIGEASPKDFTVESMAAYSESGNIGDLERYRPKTVKIGNIEHSFNNETQKYEPVVDYGDAGLSQQEAAAAENQAASQARLDFGKDKSKFESGMTQYLTSISAAEQKQTVVRNTADKIRDLVGGWSNKYGSSLSGIPGSQARTLKGLMDTMKANSAFSTLTDLKASGGTLGAISEAELNLLERAWGALDQGGDIVEFERVLDQLVDQNSGSVQRTRNAYDMDKSRYSGSYDDSQRKIQDENTVSWDDLP